MGIKSVYVCDNCGKEQVFETSPIQIGMDIAHPTFIHTHNPDYDNTTGLIGDQHFCDENCVQECINKKKKEAK